MKIISKENIKWWEYRRFKFNLYILLIGFSSLAMLYLLSIFLERPIFFFFFIPIAFLYWVFLNIIYTLFWFSFELIVHKKNRINISKIKVFKVIVLITAFLNLGIIIFYLLLPL
jgi:hypothetical protein